MGTKMFKKSAKNVTYKTVWCAGPSLDGVYSIRHVLRGCCRFLSPVMIEDDN